MGRGRSSKAWRKTVRMLDGLCGMADGLVLDPLILALTDAKGRAEEDRLSRPEGAAAAPTPGEAASKEADEQFERYRAEAGIPDEGPGSPA